MAAMLSRPQCVNTLKLSDAYPSFESVVFGSGKGLLAIRGQPITIWTFTNNTNLSSPILAPLLRGYPGVSHHKELVIQKQIAYNDLMYGRCSDADTFTTFNYIILRFTPYTISVNTPPVGVTTEKSDIVNDVVNMPAPQGNDVSHFSDMGHGHGSFNEVA